MKRNAHGFTLIEVLVALALMAIAIFGMASMGTMTLQADDQSRFMNGAMSLAQAKLEDLRLLPRSQADWVSGSHSEPNLNEQGTTTGGGRHPYTRQWVVTSSYNGNANLSRVAVTVSWWDHGGPRSVQVASLFW